MFTISRKAKLKENLEWGPCSRKNSPVLEDVNRWIHDQGEERVTFNNRPLIDPTEKNDVEYRNGRIGMNVGLGG